MCGTQVGPFEGWFKFYMRKEKEVKPVAQNKSDVSLCPAGRDVRATRATWICPWNRLFFRHPHVPHPPPTDSILPRRGSCSLQSESGLLHADASGVASPSTAPGTASSFASQGTLCHRTHPLACDALPTELHRDSTQGACSVKQARVPFYRGA